MKIFFQNLQKIKITFVSITGILSGLGFLRYVEFVTKANISDTVYGGLMLWAIPFSVLVWVLLRLNLKQFYANTLIGIFFFSAVVYWLFLENPPVLISSIFFRDENFSGIFVFAGLLLASMNIVEHFLFSNDAIRLVALTFFSILFITEIIPALTDSFLTKPHTFLVFLLAVAILSSIWIVIGELLFFIINELTQKAGIYAEKK
jgi:hypothetical protein